MQIVFFSSKSYDEHFFQAANSQFGYKLRFLDVKLSMQTVGLIQDEEVLCVFVNDTLDRAVLQQLADTQVRLIALRCAGFNNVDIHAANELGMRVVRVPDYSPYSVAEHTIGLMLSLNRKIHRAYNRVREGNFALEGMMGFDFNGRTMGIIGTGRIGSIVAKITAAMGMNIIAYDIQENTACLDMGVEYVDLQRLYADSDVISLHCPLTKHTQHMIDAEALEHMKTGVLLINTGRGALLDTCAVINALKTKKIGSLGLDVYEYENNLFFEDLSCEIIEDDIFERLLTFHNVLITAHQGFFTHDALQNIAETTYANIAQYDRAEHLSNEVRATELA